MKTPRRLTPGDEPSTLGPSFVEPGLARGVIAGEACTELGSEFPRPLRVSWLRRWLGFTHKAARAQAGRGDAARA